MTIQNITPNPEVAEMHDELEAVRACVKGSYFVKKLGYKLLPHPSSIDKTSPEQIARYNQYIADADFDEFPGTTLTTMLDKMSIAETEVMLPERLEYLRED